MTEESTAVLEQVESDIEQETDKLIHLIVPSAVLYCSDVPITCIKDRSIIGQVFLSDVA